MVVVVDTHQSQSVAVRCVHGCVGTGATFVGGALGLGVYLQHCNHQQQHWPGVTQKGLDVDKPEQAEGLDACRLDNIPRRAEQQAMHIPRSVQKNLGVTLCSALERGTYLYSNRTRKTVNMSTGAL